MNARRIIENGDVWTPNGFIPQGTVVIDGEQIVEVLEAGAPVSDGERIDARGMLVIPGFVDTHSHHREPGFTHKEDITSATRAAAAGGVTTSIGMPNVNPPLNDLAGYKRVLELYSAKSLVDYNMNPAPTVAHEVPLMAEAGALAFKIFQVVDTKRSYPHMPGLGVTDDGEMLEIFENVHTTGLPLMVHPHNQELMDRFEQRFWARGQTGPLAYAEAQRMYDGLVWNTAIQGLLLLQEAVGTRLHILHLVTTQSIEMVRRAKAAGRAVTAEVNGFALFLGDWETIKRNGPRALGRWVPQEVKDALWAGIQDGTVDVLGTDHGPHTLEEKAPGWEDMWKAPSAVPQLQDYMSQLLDKGVWPARISLDAAIRVASYNPAKVFGLYPKKGTIEPGADADIVIVDPHLDVEFRDEFALSKCGWTPYHGERARGGPVHTIVRGRSVYRDGNVLGEPGWGELALRQN